MRRLSAQTGRILAEVLRIQRWAGGDSVSAARIFGLMNGFESTLRREAERGVITEATQEKVEDILEEIEGGEQSPTWMWVKGRLHSAGIDESDARAVMELCRLEGRFVDALDQIHKATGGHEGHAPDLPEHQWFGSLHYVELVDFSGDNRKPLHAVFAPSVPAVGDSITPQGGETMVVVDVDHVVISQGEEGEKVVHYLVPHVLLKPLQEVEGDETDD